MNDLIFSNHKLLFVFYHIEKCAGSSLRIILYNFFKNFLKPSRIFIPEFNKNKVLNLTNQAYTKIRSKGDDYIKFLSKLKVILCHISKDDPGFSLQSRFEITVLRNPVSRAISHYNFFGRSHFGNKDFDKLSDSEFEVYMRSSGNVMTWRLSGNLGNLDLAKRNLMNMTHVLVVETFDKDLANLEYKMNKFFFQDASMKKVHRNKQRGKPKKYYSKEFIDKIIPYLKQDIELYKFFIRLRFNFKKLISSYYK
jgi:hypothetical protein